MSPTACCCRPLGDPAPQVLDDDVASLSLTRRALVLREFDNAELYRVALTSEPRGLVRVDLSYVSTDNPDFALLVNPGVLAFDRFNWAQGFEVSVLVR